MVEAARQDHNLRNTSLQSSAMGDGVRTDRTASNQHMAVGREASDLLAKPGHGGRRKPTTRASEGKPTTSESRPKKGRPTNNKQRTNTGNGPERTIKRHNNHFSVYIMICSIKITSSDQRERVAVVGSERSGAE